MIFRLVNVTGKKQKMVSFVPVFFDKAMKNEDIIIFVPPNKKMQLLDVDDIKSLIERVVMKGSDVFGIFNVASEDNKSILDIARIIVKLTKSDSKIVCTNQEYEKESLINSRKAEETFNWKAKKTIEDILMECYRERSGSNVTCDAIS